MELELPKRPKAPARKRRKELVEAEAEVENKASSSKETGPEVEKISSRSVQGALHADPEIVERPSLGLIYPSLEKVSLGEEGEEPQASPALKSESSSKDLQATSDEVEISESLQIVNELLDQVCKEFKTTGLSSEAEKSVETDDQEGAERPMIQVLDAEPEKIHTGICLEEPEVLNVQVVPNDLNNVENNRVSDLTTSSSKATDPDSLVPDFPGTAFDVPTHPVQTTVDADYDQLQPLNLPDARRTASIGFDIENSLDLLEQTFENLASVSNLDVIDTQTDNENMENNLARFSCDFSCNLNTQVQKVSPVQQSKDIFYNHQRRCEDLPLSAVAQSIEFNNEVQMFTTSTGVAIPQLFEQESPVAAARSPDVLDHIPRFCTSFKQLNALKPKVQQHKNQAGTSANSGVQLDVSWDDLADIYGLNNSIDENTEVMIEYYQMLLKENLLPPRPKTPQPVEDRQPSQVTIMKVKTTVDQSDSPSMQNYYAAASSASASSRSKARPNSKKSGQGGSSQSRRQKPSFSQAQARSPPRSSTSRQIQVASTSPRPFSATLQRNDSWTRKLSIRTRSAISRVRTRVQSIFGRKMNSPNSSGNGAIKSSRLSTVHVDVPVVPLPLPVAMNPSLL